MNRRGAVGARGAFAVRLVVVLLVALACSASPTISLAAAPDSAPPAGEPVTTEVGGERPPITANEFFPEDRDVTDCIGVLERPGCGSESRGGWRQFLLLGVMSAGLIIVFGNVARIVRRNRS